MRTYGPKADDYDAATQGDLGGVPTPEAWNTVGSDGGRTSFKNGWSSFGGAFPNAQYYKDPFGVVHLRGVVKGGNVAYAMFTLPIGYRPTGGEEVFAAQTFGSVRTVSVQVNGHVLTGATNNALIFLSGVSFRTI